MFPRPMIHSCPKDSFAYGNEVLAGELLTLDLKEMEPSGREFRLQLAVAGSHKSALHFERTDASTETYRQKPRKDGGQGLLAHSDFLVLFVLVRMTSNQDSIAAARILSNIDCKTMKLLLLILAMLSCR